MISITQVDIHSCDSFSSRCSPLLLGGGAFLSRMSPITLTIITYRIKLSMKQQLKKCTANALHKLKCLGKQKCHN